MFSIWKRLRIKFYLLTHPFLWGTKCHLEGLPEILVPERLSLGAHVSLNDRICLQCHGGIVIGDNVIISRGATILTYGLETKLYGSNAEKKCWTHVASPVKIGRGTWICANSTILGGVEIPEHCIIAAGSVVSKTLTIPKALYGGVPAKFIRELD